MFTRYHLSEMMTVDFCCCFKCIYCCHIITYQIIMIALRHWSDILITVQSSASFTVRIAVEIFFLFISVVYVDTATAWSNDSPFFFSFSHFFPQMDPGLRFIFLLSILSHLPYSLLFCWFLFLTTASWNRSGWHPRSLTGQCTSHLPLLLHTFSPLFLLSSNTSQGFIAPSGLLLTASNHVSPLHIAVFPPI